MADTIIGAGPFDPQANAKLQRGGILRGNRWLMFVAGAVVAGGGMFAVNAWIGDLFQIGSSDAAIEVKPSRSTVTAFNLEPINMPVTAASTPPPKKLETVEEKVEAPVKRPPPARQGVGGGGARKAELPSKISWNVEVAGGQNMDWVQDARRPVVGFGCALRPGASLISAALNSVIDSGVTPGQIIATVTSDVFDVDGVGRLLIPQGSKLVGTYQNALQFGQLRLGIVWQEAVLPNGRQLTLADSNGLDVAGSQGMGGTVNTNWGQILAVAAIFTVFDAAQRATVPDQESYAASIADAAATRYSQVGTSVVNKIMDQAVVIRIPAGTELIVSPAKTLVVC